MSTHGAVRTLQRHATGTQTHVTPCPQRPSARRCAAAESVCAAAYANGGYTTPSRETAVYGPQRPLYARVGRRAAVYPRCAVQRRQFSRNGIVFPLRKASAGFPIPRGTRPVAPEFGGIRLCDRLMYFRPLAGYDAPSHGASVPAREVAPVPPSGGRRAESRHDGRSRGRAPQVGTRRLRRAVRRRGRQTAGEPERDSRGQRTC